MFIKAYKARRGSAWADSYKEKEPIIVFTELFNSGKFHGQFKAPSNFKEGEKHPGIYNST